MLLRPPAIETCTIVFGSEQTFPITRTIVSAAAALSSDVVELASVGVGDHGDARFVETDSADQPVVAAKRMKTSLERVEQIVHDAVPGRAGEDHADFIGNEAPLPTKRPERVGDDLRRHADDRL